MLFNKSEFEFIFFFYSKLGGKFKNKFGVVVEEGDDDLRVNY